MRALVTGLVQDVPRAKYKVSEKLANYDISYLQADPGRVLYLWLLELRLSFILSLSTPLPTFLHIVYSRATLGYLRIRTVAIPSGLSVLNEILLQTFFSPDFNSDAILGPAALEYISDFFTRHNRTLNSLATLIQLAYIKHFSINPLTSLVYSTPQTQSPALLEASLRSILAANENAMDGVTGADEAKEKIIPIIDGSRTKVEKRYKSNKIAFNLTRLMELFFVKEGYKGLVWNLENDWDLCTIFGGVFLKKKSGALERSLGHLKLIVKCKKTRPDQLRRLSQEIRGVLLPIDPEGDENLVTAQTELTDLVGSLPQSQTLDENSKTVAAEIADWIDEFLKDLLLERLEDIPLWEIWYTGMTPFPSELVNPSIRASLLSGLLRPLEFTAPSSSSSLTTQTTRESGNKFTETTTDESLWGLPDTSILFRRYLDTVLETQREGVKKERARGRVEGKGKGDGRKKGGSGSSSPSKGQGRGGGKATSAPATPKKSPTKKASQQSPTKTQKGKQRQRPEEEEVDDDIMDTDEGEGEDEDEEETEEKWQIEVQARFIRALHELDYLGFIKHTKRRADHVARTVFDINDE